jgi:hypothetical protein
LALNRGWRGGGVGLSTLTFDPIVDRIILFSASPRHAACATIVAVCRRRRIGSGFALISALRPAEFT